MSELLNYQMKFSENVAKLIAEIYKLGYSCTLGEVYRTKMQQKIYYDRGLTHTLKSNHMRRLAIDLFIFKDGVLLEEVNQLAYFGKYWESLHYLNRWGGHFKSLTDTPHFELNAP